MSDAWVRAANMANGVFVRLDHDCDRVIGAFVGEPYAYGVHWTGEKYAECEGDDCTLCQTTGGVTVRVRINFYVPAEGAMRVIEGGTIWFRDVLKARDRYRFNKWLFEITRHGESGDQATTYSIMPEETIDEKLRTQIEESELHDLSKLHNAEVA